MEGLFDNELKGLGGGFLPGPPRLDFLYRIVVDCDPPIEVGLTPGGVKRVIPIVGGRFQGPQMRGIVLPLGADWNTTDLGNRGNRRVDTRYLLETEDGVVISLSTLGFSRRSEEALSMRESGERVDPSLYYFRQHLFFDAPLGRYEWLNSVVAFGTVMSKFQGGPGVIYDAYVVL